MTTATASLVAKAAWHPCSMYILEMTGSENIVQQVSFQKPCRFVVDWNTSLANAEHRAEALVWPGLCSNSCTTFATTCSGILLKFAIHFSSSPYFAWKCASEFALAF